MKKISRHRTRECLLQALYSRSALGAVFDRDGFLDAFYDDSIRETIDMPYFDAVFSGVIEREGVLLSIIERFAPKFDISIMPIGNLLPIMIASYEMLYLTIDTVPEKVSMDEAIELSKAFSDENARAMVNGVLNALKNEKETIKVELEKADKKSYFFVN